MEWSWPESVSSNRQRVMEELIQGRALASQLFRVLDDQKSSLLVKSEDDVGSAEGLVSKILGSFANTLLILKGKESESESESDQIQASSGGSSSWIDHDDDHTAIKSEDSQERCKPTLTLKDRKGSYKRRKTSHSWIRDTPALTDDGHAWRKYGQKVILNAKNPRNYFRCTHKFDQSCQATKHTQKIQENPPLFRTTYIGNHICKDYSRTSELVLDCTSPRDGSKFINFSTNNNINLTSNKPEHPFFSSFTSSVQKEEFIREEMQQSDRHLRTTVHNHFSVYDDYVVSADPTMFKSSEAPLSGYSSSLDQYDHEDDVISRLLVGSYEFDGEGLLYEF